MTIEKTYDSVAKGYAEAFSREHEKKPMDREILLRFSQEIGDRRPVWDLGCGPGQTAQYLKDLGVEISGLDLSERLLTLARLNHPDIHFQRGNVLELEFEKIEIMERAPYPEVEYQSQRAYVFTKKPADCSC